MYTQDSSGTQLSAEVMQYYYENKFLPRAKFALIHDQGSQKRSQSQGVGPTTRFSLMAPLSVSTTALTQGTNPAEDTSLSESNIDVTVAEYGKWSKIAKFLSLTTIDQNNAEKASVFGQNAGETLDTIVRNELFNSGTVKYANLRANLNAITASDVATVVDIMRCVRDLKTAKAMPYADGSFLGKFNQYTDLDLMRDTTWVNVKSYSDPKDMYNGEVGKIFGVRVIETINPKSETNGSSVVCYSNFIHGDNAFGTYDLSGDPVKLYVKISNDNDTSNPLSRFSTMGWGGTYAAKVLRPTWVETLKSAASA